jgi:dienelactone hydrolase
MRHILTTEQAALAMLRQPPALRFRGSTKAQWQAWRRRFAAALKRLLGPRPPPVPLRVESLGRVRQDGYVREKILFQTDAFASVPAYVLIPDGASRRSPRPGLLCAHGHGPGKDEAVGLVAPTLPQADFAKRLAQAGFVCIVPDWRSFGERRDRHEYLHAWPGEHGTDGCDLSQLVYGYFGYQLLNLDLGDASRCIDVLSKRAEVDPRRIGCIGGSFGGTMTAFATAFDHRIRAAVVAVYLSSIADAIGPRGKGNTCGSQFLHGLRAVGEIADVVGLIAPRPLMVQIGRHDPCFAPDDALRAQRHLRRIYTAAGTPHRLELDLFDGGHEYDVPRAVEFLARELDLDASFARKARRG